MDLKGKRKGRPPRRGEGFGADIGRLYQLLQKAGEEGLSFTGLQRGLKISDGALERLTAAAVRSGAVKKEEGRYYLARQNRKAGKKLTGKLVRLKPTFGFVRVEEDGEERDVFVPGSKLRGALPGDKLEIIVYKEQGGHEESGEVTRILEMGSPVYAGIVRQNGQAVSLPGAWDGELPLQDGQGLQEGERVLVEILRRGDSHRDYRATLLKSYGDGDKASNCAASILEAAGIYPQFPEEALSEAKFLCGRGIRPE